MSIYLIGIDFQFVRSFSPKHIHQTSSVWFIRTEYNDERTERYSIQNEHVKYLLVKLQTWKLFNKIASIHLTLEYVRGKYRHKTCSFF